MKVDDLIKFLEEHKGKEVEISIDVSTSEEDAFKRAFSDEFFEVLENGEKIVLLFGGYLNE